MSDKLVKFLGDTGNYDLLGVENGFRKLAELYINQLVDEGKWFTVCHKIDSKQVDIMSIQGDDGVKLGSLIADIFQEGSYRTSIYKYLLMNFMCYIEVPTMSFKSDTGGFSNTFNKILATSNTHIVAEWLGCSEEDLPEKYKTRVWGINMDDGEDELPYIKLTESPKDGVRKASCPRSNIDVSERGTRVVPLFMLKAGVDALSAKIKKDIVKVTFLKDNGQFRNLFTTINFPIIKEIYGSGDFYDGSVFDSFNGDFFANKNMCKGYIRVPEIGGSRYDTPVRSINYARIVEIDYNSEPDLSFIDIDLSTVVSSFQDGVMAHPSNSEGIIEMLESFGMDDGYWDKNGIRVGGNEGHEGRLVKHSRDMTSLLQWVEERSMMLSTVFTRDLCLFMLSNPQWFPDFDGKPKDSVFGSGGDIGLA